MTEPEATATPTTARAPARDCYFAAPYAAMLAPFISTEQTRYYLNGILVQPHPAGGVLLVATNGHIMGVAHDPKGYANAQWICPIPNVFLEYIKRDAKKVTWGEVEPKRIWFRRDTVYLMDTPMPADFQPDNIGHHHIALTHKPSIDGKYPDWFRVLPPQEGAPSVFRANGRYLSAFAKVAKYARGLGLDADVTDRASLLMWQTEPLAPLQVRIQGIDNFYGVLMPIRIENGDEGRPKPDWLINSIAAPQSQPA